jgi:NO-binding membrane sensor protein with MHYT domain
MIRDRAPGPPMNDDASSFSSLLLFCSLAWAVAVLALHVVLGWTRRGLRSANRRSRAVALLIGGTTLGSAVCATAVLSLTSESLAFALGYRALAGLQIWLLAVAVATVVAAALTWARQWWQQPLTALLLAVLVAGVLFGWIHAAGLRPGVHWRLEFVAAACALMTFGFSGALWMAFGATAHDSERRTAWTLGAAGVFGLALVGGSQIAMAGAGLLGQTSSSYLGELPASVLSLVCGALMPLVLTVMAIDLAVRRVRRNGSARTAHTSGGTHHRRRRRQRVTGP